MQVSITVNILRKRENQQQSSIFTWWQQPQFMFIVVPEKNIFTTLLGSDLVSWSINEYHNILHTYREAQQNSENKRCSYEKWLLHLQFLHGKSLITVSISLLENVVSQTDKPCQQEIALEIMEVRTS